jgi:hypothetical protein
VVLGATKMRPRAARGLDLRIVIGGGARGGGAAASVPDATRVKAVPNSTARPPINKWRERTLHERDETDRRSLLLTSRAERPEWAPARQRQGEARSEKVMNPICHLAGRRSRHSSVIVDNMRIGIIGGVDRSGNLLQEVAEARGHQLELHTGVMSSGVAASSLRALIARSELVVVVTDINSHNAVRSARREAKLQNRPLRIVRRMGSSQFAALLRGLATS